MPPDDSPRMGPSRRVKTADWGSVPMRTSARRFRSASLAILIGVCILLSAVGQGQAREIEIDGTADCGLRSGSHCSIDSTLALWTDDISGEKERVEVDVRWIKDDLDKIDQDDHVCLVVEDRGGGRLRGVGVSQTCKFDSGTVNPGLPPAARRSASSRSATRMTTTTTPSSRRSGRPAPPQPQPGRPVLSPASSRTR